jgi:hypothetical protein
VKRLISLIRRSIETPQLRVVSLTDAVPGSFEGLRSDRHADPAVPVAEELKPQQGPLDRAGDRRLLSVDAQLQALLDVAA